MQEINWSQLGKEIAMMPNGIAVLRVLQAHGVVNLVRFGQQGVEQSCDIKTVIDYAHRT